MKEKLAKIRQEAIERIKNATSMESLNELKVAYLGKKGQMTEVLKGMKDVEASERPLVGQMVNDTRNEIENCFEVIAVYGFYKVNTAICSIAVNILFVFVYAYYIA